MLMDPLEMKFDIILTDANDIQSAFEADSNTIQFKCVSQSELGVISLIVSRENAIKLIALPYTNGAGPAFR